jgi:hypothetical protein
VLRSAVPRRPLEAIPLQPTSGAPSPQANSDSSFGSNYLPNSDVISRPFAERMLRMRLGQLDDALSCTRGHHSTTASCPGSMSSPRRAGQYRGRCLRHCTVIRTCYECNLSHPILKG